MRYNEQIVKNAWAQGQTFPEDGMEESFTYLGQFEEEIINGKWISGDVFVFTNKGKLNYLIGDKILTHALIDKKMFILGYLP
jgi:hypothetical protein